MSYARTIVVEPTYVAMPDAELELETMDGETASMSLSVRGDVIALSDGFRRPEHGPWTWIDCPDEEIVRVFGSFLAHAFEDEEAGNEWPVLDSTADEWLDALTLAGE